MARTTVVTCDRCGKEFSDKTAGSGFISNQHFITIGFAEVCYRNYDYELCPECMDKLERFLKMEKY